MAYTSNYMKQLFGDTKDYKSNYFKSGKQNEVKESPPVEVKQVKLAPAKATKNTETPSENFSGGRTSAGGGRNSASWLDVAKNAALSGLNQFNKGLFSTLDLILPTEFLGEHDVVSNLNDYYSGLNDKYSKALEESTAGKGKAGQIVGEVAAGTAAAVPNAILALMSGGTSAAATGTTASLEAASAAAGTSGILSTASAAAQQLIKNPMYWSSVSQTLGTDYEEAKADGAGEAEAIGAAFISSLLNAGVEVSGGVETLPGALQSGSKSAIREWVKSALDEGKEEVVQSVISNLTQKAIYDRDKEYFSTTDQNAVVNPGRMAQEFGMGAAIGGILGGAQTALGKVQSGLFLPGSGLDTPVTPVELPTATPTTQTTTAPNVTAPTQDTTAQNAAPGGVQAQKNTVPNVRAVENAAGVTPAESETNAVSQLRPNGSGTTVSPEPIVTTTQEKVNQIVSAQLEKGKGYASLTELAREISTAIPDNAKTAVDAFSGLLDSEEYGVNAAGQLYRKSAGSHIDNRDIATVGSRSVKSFQFENPQLHSYFVEAAQSLKSDLANTTRGERFYAAASMDTSDPMDGKWSGVKRSTTEGIATLKDDWHLSYEDIEKAADAIINDKGQENYAAAKRVEIILDDMLTNGYTDPVGFPVAPNQEYIRAKAEIKGSKPAAEAGEGEPLPLYDVQEDAAQRQIFEPPMDTNVDGFGQNTVGAAQAQTGAALNGKKRAKKSPTENESVKEIVNDPDVVGAKSITGEFAQALTSSGIDYNKDFARNLDAAAGGNATIREALRNLIERPFLSAKTNYANNVRSQLNDLKKTMDGLGIKKGSKESAAVQRYGEGQYQDEAGEVHEYTESMLREEFPDTWQNIVKAAQYSRRLYDGYVDRLNETLKKIYPNAIGKAMEDEAKYTSKASFLSEMAKEQQNTLDSLQERLHERKNQLARMSEGTQRYADLQNTISRIERQAETVRSKISSLQEQADISNAKAAAVHSRIVSGDVLRNKRLSKRTDYFHHFNEMAEGWEALKNILTTPADINSKLAGVSDFTKPKSKWAGFMQGRKGGAYTEDAVGGLLTYIPQAEYKINLDPIIAENRNIIKTLAEETEDTRNANKFIEWMTDWTNDLAGKTNPFDRAVQKVVGRKAISVAKWLSSRAKANAVVGNVRSATAQVFNLPNALVYIKSPKAWKNGAKIYGRALGGDETAKSLYAESGFLNERYLDDAVSQFDEGLLKKPEKFANWMLTVGDKEVAKLIWASAYEQGMEKNIADPIEYADDITRRSIAGRGVGEVPLMQKAVMTQLFAPFQVEVNNTWQLMKEAAGDKNVVGLLAMFALSFLMNSVTRELFGYDVAIDPFNAVIEGIEGWDKDNLLGSAAGVAGRVGGEFLSNMPFGAQIGSIAISDETDREKLFGDADPSRFGTGNIGLDAVADTFTSALDAIKEEDVTKLDLMTPLTNFALPYGGKQVGRLIEGAQDLGLLPILEKEEGLTIQPDAGSKNKNGKLRFAVDENNPFDVAKLMLLGPFSTKGGMDYLEEGYTALGEKQTYAAMEAAKMGVDLVDYMAAYRGMSKAEKESEKRAVIQNMDLTDEEKAYIYRYAMLSSDEKEKERNVFDSLVDGGSDVGLIGSTLMSIRDAEKQDGKLQVIGNAGVSEREAKELLGMVMGTNLKTEEGNATAYAKLLDAMNTELGVEEVVELKNSGANLDRFLGYTDAGMDAGAAYDLSLAAVEMREKEDIEGSFTIEENARWIQSAGLTNSQQEIAWLVTYPEWAEKAAEKGVSNSEYIQYKVATYGHTKDADKRAALVAAGFSSAEARTLVNKIG